MKGAIFELIVHIITDDIDKRIYYVEFVDNLIRYCNLFTNGGYTAIRDQIHWMPNQEPWRRKDQHYLSGLTMQIK